MFSTVAGGKATANEVWRSAFADGNAVVAALTCGGPDSAGVTGLPAVSCGLAASRRCGNFFSPREAADGMGWETDGSTAGWRGDAGAVWSPVAAGGTHAGSSNGTSGMRT